MTISSKDGLVDQISYFNKTVASKDMSGYYLLLNGEFAYNKSYSVGFDFGSIKRLDCYPMGALSTLYICFSVKKYDSDFIKTYFDSLKWYKEIYMIAAEGARNHGLLNVPTEDFFATRHTLPTNLKEQKKIAAFMKLLERRIDAQRRLVEALKSYKRGMLERLFSSNLSFSGSSQMANIVPLREVFCKISDRNSNGTVHNVVTNSAELGLLPQRDYFDKDIAVAENTQNYFVIVEGDFVYNPRKSKSAPYGPFNVYRSKEAGIVSPLYTCLRSIADVNLDYLYWYFQSTAWHRYMYDNGSQGVRHDRVSMTDELLFAIPVVLPDKQLQDKIVAVMSSIQRLYEAEAAKSDCLQSEKAQFLRSLFA